MSVLRPTYPAAACGLCNERPVGPTSRWVCAECEIVPVGELVARLGANGLYFIAHVVLEEHGYLDADHDVTPAGREWLTDPDLWGTDPLELLALAPLAIVEGAA